MYTSISVGHSKEAAHRGLELIELSYLTMSHCTLMIFIRASTFMLGASTECCVLYMLAYFHVSVLL